MNYIPCNNIIIVTGVEGDMVNWLPEKTMLPEAKPRVTLFSRGANSPCHPKTTVTIYFIIPNTYWLLFVIKLNCEIACVNKFYSTSRYLKYKYVINTKFIYNCD